MRKVLRWAFLAGFWAFMIGWLWSATKSHFDL
jgi:hypothetical protein